MQSPIKYKCDECDVWVEDWQYHNCTDYSDDRTLEEKRDFEMIFEDLT